LLGAIALAMFFVEPAWGDVVITQKINSSMMGGFINMNGTMVTSISVDRQRVDTEMKSDMLIQDAPAVKATSIFRLDKELLWNLNHDGKTYSEMTFAQIRALADSSYVDGQFKMGEGETITDDIELGKPEFSIDQTGKKKEINGFACDEVMMRMIMRAKDKRTGDTGSFLLHNDMWITNKCPGWEDYRNFSKKSVEKMGNLEDLQSPASAMAMMGFDLQAMVKEMEKIDGFPILQNMAMTMTGDLKKLADQQMAEQQEAMAQAAEALKGLGNLMGQTGGDEEKANTVGEPGVLFKATIEVQSIKPGPVEAATYEIPQGYSKAGY